MVAAACGGPQAGEPEAPDPVAEIPVAEISEETVQEEPMFLWLEEIEGEEALAWVREVNEASEARLQAHPLFGAFEEDALEVLTSSENIPWPVLRGDRVYNFWRDATHERGLWRRTSPEDYRNDEPEWEVLLDVDALAEEEDENWVWAGANLLYPSYGRAIIGLSIGGADASVRRELDLETGTFVEDGFVLPESKSSVAWRDEDSVFLAPAFTEEDMTTSGYPRRVLIWQRGTPREEAVEVFAGEREDVGVWGSRVWDGDAAHDVIVRSRSFYTRDYQFLIDGELVPLAIPEDARMVGILDGQLLVELKSDWERDGETFPQGALLAMPVEGVASGELVFEALFAPGPRQSLNGVSRTATTVLVSILDNVRGQFIRFHREDGSWVQTALQEPVLGSLGVVSTDQGTDQFYFSFSDFLTPSTLIEAHAVEGSENTVRNSPVWFDAEGMNVEQHEAESADGTRIPYFLVTPAGFVPAGNAPTLIAAYGGFEISRTPSYGGVLGRNWLTRGGVYVVANIRGGGEFGPAWHQAALRENRQRSFDDLIAVGEDLVARGITRPAHMGIQGGSNGGLLVGAVMVQRPELFGAVVCAVPLLDMERFHRLLAGASWMAEYGNPDDPEDLAFLRAYSPLQNLREDVDYPVPFIWTSTRDDRVHPGHARRMTARMMELGHDVLYYENIEGGHGGAANQRQRAYIAALTYAYLWNRLGEHDAATGPDEHPPEMARED